MPSQRKIRKYTKYRDLMRRYYWKAWIVRWTERDRWRQDALKHILTRLESSRA